MSRIAVVTPRDHCLAPARAIDAPLAGGRYGRMFPELPQLEAPDELLFALGARDGLCDGTETADDDDPQVAAGWPFFGQFIAHDITADRSPLRHLGMGRPPVNFRSPQLNLECIYGDGPTGSPYLYERADPAKLLVGANDGGRPDDVPRNPEGIALVGDPRNDVHLFINQLHVAMLKLHNRLVDRLREDGTPEAELFDEARRAATWHYEWIVLNEFLPLVVGEELAHELRSDGPRFFLPGEHAFIPLEFADAGFRYGHSQIRRTYRINEVEQEAVPLFPDLVGFRPVPAARTVQWSLMFDIDGRSAQRAKLIDGRLPGSLINLPREITGDVPVDEYHSLAVRDLERGSATGLPAGETLARHLGVEPLTAAEVGIEGGGDGTPLWFYVLREAEVRAGGHRLGPVGGRIVGEVLVGLVDGNPASHRALEPDWQPTLPAGHGSRFGLADVLEPVSA